MVICMLFTRINMARRHNIIEHTIIREDEDVSQCSGIGYRRYTKINCRIEKRC